jgi:hypothetical protein
MFEMESIDHHINRMLDSSDYEIFCSDNPTQLVGLSEQNTGGKPTSTYLTYNGLS